MMVLPLSLTAGVLMAGQVEQDVVTVLRVRKRGLMGI
jgi:hypothetical protein